MHAFTRLRNDADLFRIWYVVIGLTLMLSIMDLTDGVRVDARFLLRGTIETALAVLAAGGRKWARTTLGVVLVISAMSAGMLVAIDTTETVRRVVLVAYAFGMSTAAAKTFRWF